MKKLFLGAVVLGTVLVACAQKPAQQRAAPKQETGPSEVTVVAKEYAFDLPATPQAGSTTFVLQNVGEEQHEMGLVLITGDKTIEELLELRRKADKYIEDVGHASAKPGESDQFDVTLEAGRYGYACFVEASDGEPHALKGMYGEFTVA